MLLAKNLISGYKLRCNDPFYAETFSEHMKNVNFKYFSILAIAKNIKIGKQQLKQFPLRKIIGASWGIEGYYVPYLLIFRRMT